MAILISPPVSVNVCPICGGVQILKTGVSCPQCRPEVATFFVEGVDYRMGVELYFESQSPMAVAAWLRQKGFEWTNGGFVRTSDGGKVLYARICLSGEFLTAEQMAFQLLPWFAS
jgi:hypothetical protein